MWHCLRCGETAEDNFTECWKCGAGRDGRLPDENELSTHERLAAENSEIAHEMPNSLACLRCSGVVSYKGTIRFDHSPLWLTGELHLMDEHLEMYACPRCGHIEFLAPGFIARS